MTFWNRVKIQIDKQKTTFRWLSEHLDVPESTVSRWRNNDMFPRADEAVKMAQELGVTVEYLVTGRYSKSLDLNAFEKETLQLLRKISDEDKEVVRSLLTSLAKKHSFDLSTQTDGQKQEIG